MYGCNGEITLRKMGCSNEKVSVEDGEKLLFAVSSVCKGTRQAASSGETEGQKLRNPHVEQLKRPQLMP